MLSCATAMLMMELDEQPPDGACACPTVSRQLRQELMQDLERKKRTILSKQYRFGNMLTERQQLVQ